eukprot:Lithocolla_globosa_v1_NODE_5244_length_1276_cov_6.199017.p2 type:complete len:153 gc:universal NODE_5244_length_1276_cov_6.199017:1124-666(-)
MDVYFRVEGHQTDVLQDTGNTTNITKFRKLVKTESSNLLQNYDASEVVLTLGKADDLKSRQEITTELIEQHGGVENLMKSFENSENNPIIVVLPDSKDSTEVEKTKAEMVILSKPNPWIDIEVFNLQKEAVKMKSLFQSHKFSIVVLLRRFG